MQRILFCNIGWMKDYRGLNNDNISDGGAFVKERHYGHEIFNFQPYRGYMYGYVQPPKETINLERLGSSEEAESVSPILVVWVAKNPSGGTYIVGWYKNATVFSDWQNPPANSNRNYNGERFGYYVKARNKDCKLLSIDRRTFQVPRKGRVQMGHSNTWFADKSKHKVFEEKARKYINSGGKQKLKTKKTKKSTGGGYQTNPYIREKVEKVAIRKTIKYYENWGYEVDSVERDNVGWDLEARSGSKLLRIEVKGLSQGTIQFELTPNEYQKMDEYKNNYRISVVTNALNKKPNINIFLYSQDSGRWENDEGRSLEIQEKVSAVMKA